MNLIFSNYHIRKWQTQHTGLTYSKTFCSKKEYTNLFWKILNSESPDVQSLIQLYSSLFLKNKHAILRKLKGPCFGITMALIDFHLKNPQLSIDDISDSPAFIKTALFYSLIDIVRAKIETTHKEKMVEEESPYQEQINFFSSFQKQTIKTDEDLTKFKQSIQKIINDSNGSVMIVRVWHLLNFEKTLGHKKLKWIPAHSIFICLNSSLDQFYFYDINLKALVRTGSLTALINIFLDYIQNAHADYLSPEIIWRFESKTLNTPL